MVRVSNLPTAAEIFVFPQLRNKWTPGTPKERENEVETEKDKLAKPYESR